jgi:hypothetical protein
MPPLETHRVSIPTQMEASRAKSPSPLVVETVTLKLQLCRSVSLVPNRYPLIRQVEGQNPQLMKLSEICWLDLKRHLLEIQPLDCKVRTAMTLTSSSLLQPKLNSNSKRKL